MATGTIEPPAPPAAMSGWDVLTLEQAAAYLQLPEETVRAEAEGGRLPGQRFGDQWRFLREALTAAMSPRELKINGPVRVARVPFRERPKAFPKRPTHPKLAAEYDAFEKMLPELLTSHRGEFVAIHEGRVVAVAQNPSRALNTAAKLHPGQYILVRLVTDEPQPIERLTRYCEIRTG